MKLINKIFSKTNIEYLVAVLAMLVIVFGPIQKTISYYLLSQRLATSTFALHIVKMLWGIGIILAIIYLLNVIFKRYKIKYTDICTFILIGITITSYFFSINKSVSLQGEIFRYEGLYTLLSYYMIFLNLKNIDNKNIKEYIVKLIIVMAIYQVVYGFFQVFMLSPFVYRFSIQHMASGLSANPNFFGSYTVMILALTVGLYLKTRRPVFQILSVVLMIGLTLSNSTGPFLSFFIAFIYCYIVFIKKVKFKNAILTLVLMVAVFNITVNGVISFYAHKNIDISGHYLITSDLAFGNIKDKNYSNSNGRTQLWINSLPALKKYWAVGSGPDTFKYTYPQKSGLIFDKAHNVYLQMGITTGIFSVIVYLGMLFIITLKGFKLNDPYAIGLYGAFIAYSVQAFANISVIEVAPIFFIVLGLLVNYEGEDLFKRRGKHEKIS